MLSAWFGFVILILSNVSLSKSENQTEKLQTTENGEIDEIKYNLISDDNIESNKFQISYEVSYGEFIFTRFEKCHLVEEIHIQEGTGALVCTGKTKFSRTDNVKNVTNFDDYTYSSNGFKHTGETFKVSGNYYRANKIDLIYGLEAEPIFLKLNLTQPVKKLQFERIGKDKLTVNLTIDSTFYAMNRTESFSVGIDDETGTDDLICQGQVNVLVRNSDIYYTVQKENFILGEDYAFDYVNEVKLLNDCNKMNN